MSHENNRIRCDNRFSVAPGSNPVKGRSRTIKVCTTITALLALCLCADASSAQTATDEIRTQYQYAVKVVCSMLTPHPDGDLARGTYRTAVNVHNPTDEEITFANKVALAIQPGSAPGPFSVTPFKKTALQPDGAVKFNCGTVAAFFCPIDGVCVDFAFLEGFLVIKSPVKLDVVGVYTARHNDGEVETVDVETIQPRKLRGTVKVVGEETRQKVDKRILYSAKKSLDYGQQMCGGIAGIPCSSGKVCIDDPTDDCDPDKGGADCSGICVDDTKK